MQRFLFVSTVLICCAFYSHINGLPIIVGGQPVFKNLTQTQQAELHSILFNSNATRGSIKTGVRKWVQAQQNPTLQVYIHEFIVQACIFKFMRIKGLYF